MISLDLPLIWILNTNKLRHRNYMVIFYEVALWICLLIFTMPYSDIHNATSYNIFVLTFYTIKNAETQNVRFCKIVRTLKICLNDPTCLPTTVLETLFHINENETRNIFKSQTNHLMPNQRWGQWIHENHHSEKWFKTPKLPSYHTWYTVIFLGTKTMQHVNFGISSLVFW